MSAPKWLINPPIAERLFADPQRFGFFQTMRLLEQLLTGDAPDSPRRLARHLRFDNSLALDFPPSEIESLSIELLDQGSPPDARATVSTLLACAPESLRIRLTPAFFGLLGAHGALPLHYSERLIEREQIRRDRAARAFLGIFTSRAALLFYLAWKKSRLEIDYARGHRAPALRLMSALAGISESRPAPAQPHSKDTLPAQALARYAGLLRGRAVSADSIGQLLTDYFRTPIRIEPFVGAWYPIPRRDQSQLGRGNTSLGTGAVIGERAWQSDLRIRVWIGPLEHAAFAQFLPVGRATQALRKWLSLLGCTTLEIEVRLILRMGTNDGTSLGTPSDATLGSQLGWNTYLQSPGGAPQARNETTFHIQLLPEAA